ncbi:hypothetical protein AB0I60_10135 [Actinosynnema sp. NPDC050436]|uniref:hypothetical protein n=1 Tax=Actinosynnema sp. NPDC050436 TaxID=3155659 RepID=UPI0033E7719A
MEIALLYGLVGLALLLALWPTRSVAERFLRRWGVAEPTDRQVSDAVHYLRGRRLLYPPLIFLVPAAATALAGPLGMPTPTPGALHYCAALIIALLLAEATAALRPVRGLRVAVLSPRRWHDLVPRPAVVVLLGLLGLSALLAGADLSTRSWSHRVAATAEGLSPEYRDLFLRPTGVLVLVGVVLGAAAVLGVVGLAVRRAPTGDPRVDAVLRTRTARVAVGIGIGWAGSLVGVAHGRLWSLSDLAARSPEDAPAWLAVVPATGWLGLVVLVGSLGTWMGVATPPKAAVSREGVR